MKKLNVLLLTAATAWMLQGCGGNSQKDSKAVADSANMAKDSATVDTSTTKAASPAMTVSADDAKFATMAANGGMTEVELSKLAETKATNAQIKTFAAMMVKDHTMAGNQLMSLAKSKNITLPAGIDNDSQKKVSDLNGKSGADFDKAYVNAMLDDHKKAVDAFEDASKNLKDPDLKGFVDKTLPTIKMHLNLIQKIHDQMK
ncbi:putative membrane protein [Mucilaginibacter yixingensis]|uniref:Putative membrane protein n=1 Tax=Mucilaginibacter yixingensis TaxID=1295612 RepID=A0A2T5JGP9_9SPHI|nr:DUF4142 domain-containing protein [Mucilaginibacter yixingensis]PTR01622.1 putative membrane protein [Mucilaginibacter yixingensis]